MSVQFILAPFFTIIETMSVYPILAAICNAVFPFFERQIQINDTAHRCLPTIPHPQHPNLLHFQLVLQLLQASHIEQHYAEELAFPTT